jgi:glycosyltransferase involved in cell wall biosynthesis
MAVGKSGMVSVVIPTKKRARYLPSAVEGVLRQTWENLECLVIDDTEVALRLLLSDPRMRFVAWRTAAWHRPAIAGSG